MKTPIESLYMDFIWDTWETHVSIGFKRLGEYLQKSGCNPPKKYVLPIAFNELSTSCFSIVVGSGCSDVTVFITLIGFIPLLQTGLNVSFARGW